MRFTQPSKVPNRWNCKAILDLRHLPARAANKVRKFLLSLFCAFSKCTNSFANGARGVGLNQFNSGD